MEGYSKHIVIFGGFMKKQLSVIAFVCNVLLVQPVQSMPKRKAAGSQKLENKKQKLTNETTSTFDLGKEIVLQKKMVLPVVNSESDELRAELASLKGTISILQSIIVPLMVKSGIQDDAVIELFFESLDDAGRKNMFWQVHRSNVSEQFKEHIADLIESYDLLDDEILKVLN